MTNRKIQAMETKQKIFEAAIQVMQKRGFEDTTIVQICKKAKVSIGSFYNYFDSKQDVIFMVYESADIYFKDVVEAEIAQLAIREKILAFFANYARYNIKTGVDFAKRLFGNCDNKLFIARDRYMHRLLNKVLATAHEAGVLRSDMTIDEIEIFLFVIARGVVHDWCLHDGRYDLKQKMDSYFMLILPLFID